MSQNSNNSLLSDINNLDIHSEIEGTSSQLSEISKDVNNLSVKAKESDLSTSLDSSSNSSSSENLPKEVEDQNDKVPVKRKRRRRRHRRKRKAINAYVPDEPFPKRYKKFEIFTTTPRIHLKFDEDGNADELKSSYNFKPRIIKALTKNLLVTERLDDKTISEEPAKIPQENKILNQDICSSLTITRPRIIRALSVNLTISQNL